MTTPQLRYQADLQRDGFLPDTAQAEAVAQLQDLYERLLAADESRSGLGNWWRKLRNQPTEPVRGLYFWGGVGRGKTYLMDTFYECLPFEDKYRVHFHRFMQRVHKELKALDGEKNPLLIVADGIAEQARVLCFDEFFVSDIADAMILGGLMEALFARGVTLVATSNIVPDGLYKDGLQRERFLPAIALINRYTEVINVDAGVDYRLRALESADLYYTPLDDSAEAGLEAAFDRLAPEAPKHWERIEVNGRYLSSKRVADDVVWFEFAALCDGPRSQSDYIELARVYHAVILGGIPAMGAHNDDAARRFINLVDEFYDRSVKLIVSADKPLLELYSDGRLSFEFDRTVSRLQEMQSHEYLAREHRP